MANHGDACALCRKEVFLVDKVTFNNKSYHNSPCFKCQVCSKQLMPTSAKMVANSLLCEQCAKTMQVGGNVRLISSASLFLSLTIITIKTRG